MARASSPNAVAFVAARAQASDRLLPKLRPLELSSTALEPRRARGQVGAEAIAAQRRAGAPHFLTSIRARVSILTEIHIQK